MHLIEDTRQQKGQHELKHEYWMKLGANIIRCKLPFGDYAKPPLIAIDTKADIYEIASNLMHQHARFKKECIAASVAGCQLIILIENTDGVRCVDDLERWIESEEHFQMRRSRRYYSKRIIGSSLAKTMRTMAERYGVRWEFCTPNEAGEKVLALLDEPIVCPHCGNKIRE